MKNIILVLQIITCLPHITQAAQKHGSASHLATGVGFGTNVINGKQYENGFVLITDFEINFNLHKNIYLSIDGVYLHKDYGAIDDDTVHRLDELAPGVRAEVLLADEECKLYVGLGARYYLNKTKLKIDGTNSHVMLNMGGPQFSVKLDSRILSVVIMYVQLFGDKEYSYKNDRFFKIGKLRIKAEIRPTKIFWFSILFSSCLGAENARPTGRFLSVTKIGTRALFNLGESISLFAQPSFEIPVADQKHFIHSIYGGVRLQW